MEQGIKIVVGIMVALIIAFALVFIFSERLTGANEDIMKPTQDSSGESISVTMCKTIHGEGAFLISTELDDGCAAVDCGDKYVYTGTIVDECTDGIAGDTINDKCCCKCKDF